jgi:hypothetical protein
MAGFRFYIRVPGADPGGGRGRYPAGAPGGVGGQFYTLYQTPDFFRQLRATNALRARELQAEVLENMEQSILRRQVSSGRLQHVTASPQNRASDDFGYAVGRVDYLDQSMAKYWRQIEEGYTGHVGRELTGLWGASINRITSTRVYAGKPYYPHKANRRTDMFINVGPSTRLRMGGRFATAEDLGGGNKQNFLGTTTIKEPIQPHLDYANAFRSYRPGQKSLDDIMDLVRQASRHAWRYER